MPGLPPLVALVLTLAAAEPPPPPSIPILAVFDIEDSRTTKHLSAKELGDLTAYLSAKLAEGNSYRIIPPEQMKAALAEKKKSSYHACVDEKCQIEIGKELAAQKSLATRIIQMGQKCVITTTLFDLREAASERAATFKGGCDPESLGTGLENVAAELKKAAGSANTANAANTANTTETAAPPVNAAQATEEAKALFAEGRAAYDKREAAVALEKLGAAEKKRGADWTVLNDVYYYYAATYRDLLHDNAKALEYYEKSIAVSKDLTDWPAYWAIYVEGLIAFEKSDATVALEKFLQAEKYGKAEWGFMNDLYWYIGCTYRNIKGDSVKALEYFTKAAEVAENKADWPTPWAEMWQGIILNEQGKTDEAMGRFTLAEQYSAKTDWGFLNDLYWWWGSAYRNQKHDNAKALELYTKGVNISQDKHDWPAYWEIYLQGVIAYEKGTPDPAIERFAEAEKYGTAEWRFMNDLYWYWACAYRNQKGDNVKALEYFTKCTAASEDKSDWPSQWCEMWQGNILNERGDPAGADQRFALAETYGKNDWGFLNDLYWWWGSMYRNQKGDNVRALELYTKGVEVSQDKHDWPAYWEIYLLGVIASEKNETDKAIARFQEAEKFGQAEWMFMNDLYWYLAETYRNQRHDQHTANLYYQKCVDVSQPNLADWPAYWALLRLGDLTRAEMFGAKDAGFMQELAKSKAPH